MIPLPLSHIQTASMAEGPAYKTTYGEDNVHTSWVTCEKGLTPNGSVVRGPLAQVSSYFDSRIITFSLRSPGPFGFLFQVVLSG